MTNHLKLAAALIVLVAVFGAGLFSTSGPSLDFSDAPILLPPFWSAGLRAGVTGTVVLRLKFSEGRVRQVDVMETDLRWNEMATRGVSVDRLTEDLVDVLVEPVRQWTSVVVSEHETTLTVILQQDPNLTAKRRTYRLEYGDDGIVREIVMSAPVFRPREPER